MTLLKVFKDHNEKCKRLVNIDYAPGTISKYKNCLKHLRAFIVNVMGKKDLYFSELTPMVIKDFEYYLKTACGCQHNTALKYLTNLKKIVRIALANGWLKSNPFTNVVLKFEEVDMAYLDDKELARLMAKKFDIERMEQVKDIYLFCCFTGLAFVDVKSLCTKDLVVKENQLWIRKKRHKTKNWCSGLFPAKVSPKGAMTQFFEHSLRGYRIHVCHHNFLPNHPAFPLLINGIHKAVRKNSD